MKSVRNPAVVSCLAGMMAVGLLSPASSRAQTTRPDVRNDQIYPAAEVARNAIDFDGAGFIIEGRRTYVASGSIHYPRVPPELWRDRLLRLKLAAFNTVETYAFWNFHEPRENQWDFTGGRDIDAFLRQAQDLGLYSIVRVGPYVCAEWDSGGYPVWLKFKPNFNVRTNDPTWVAWTEHWYDKILPIVANRQIHHGGNVIMVQLENEHPRGWGRVEDDGYFDQLKRAALSRGLEVPWFFSGLNHGGSPSPGKPIDPSQRTNPWFTTESWSGWFDSYRSLAVKRQREIDAAHWSILARGGGGQNFYMLHGGTNFDTWNDDSTAASYDYGAAIGQAGDLRPMYYRMKRVNQLAQAFPETFAGGQDATARFAAAVREKGVQLLGARTGADGTFAFVRNTTRDALTSNFIAGKSVRLAPFGTYPFASNLRLNDAVTLTSSDAAVLTRVRHGDTTTLVVYGEPGESKELVLASEKRMSIGRRTPGVTEASNAGLVRVTIPTNDVEECLIESPAGWVRLIAISRDLTLYTWVLGEASKQYLVFGPAFVSDLHVRDATASLTVERPYGRVLPAATLVVGAADESWRLALPADERLDTQAAPSLAAWQVSSMHESETTFDDSQWMRSEDPLPLGADGNVEAFGWYRGSLNSSSAGPAILKLPIRDDAIAFLNGKKLKESGKDGYQADLLAGENVVSVFTSHRGRKKAFNYTKRLDTYENKGFVDRPTVIQNNQSRPITRWHQRGGVSIPSDWKPFSTSSEQPAFYRTHFDATRPRETGAHPVYRVTFSGLKRGTMWVNGHNLGRYPEKINIESLYIPECWLKDGENELIVFDETGATPERVALAVERTASREIIRTSRVVNGRVDIEVPPETPRRDVELENKENLAFHAKATGPDGQPIDSLTDGDPESAWRGAKNAREPALTIDLGAERSLERLDIQWGGPQNQYRFKVETSLDQVSWKILGDETTAVPSSPDSPSELSRLQVDATPARWLRVTVSRGQPVIAEILAFSK